MSDLLGPMPPTPDVGPVAPDAGRLEPLSPGVFVWRGTDGAGRAGPNAGVIVEDDGITLVDTVCAPSAARALNEQLKGFRVPVRRVVYTSSHVDAVGGSSVFWMAARYGRPQTSALLDQPVPIDAYRRLVPAYADEFDDEFRTRPVSHTIVSAAWLTEKVCVVPTTGAQAENLVVLVPSAGVLFAGAMATFGATPNAYDGDPEAWADALGELGEQAPVIVPGVGPVGDAASMLVLAGLPVRRGRRRRRSPPDPRRPVGRLARPRARRRERRAGRPTGRRRHRRTGGHAAPPRTGLTRRPVARQGAAATSRQRP